MCNSIRGIGLHEQTRFPMYSINTSYTSLASVSRKEFQLFRQFCVFEILVMTQQ